MPRPKDTKTRQAAKPAAQEEGRDLVLAGSTELSLDVLAELEAEASAESGKIASVGGDWISTQGGRFTYQGAPLPDLRVVILDQAYDYAYYEGVFDPKKPASPLCFSLARSTEGMVPHQNGKALQDKGKGCAACWANAFGSDGNGKACKNSLRLAITPISDLLGADPKVFMLRIGPTGIKPFSQFWRKVLAMKRPLWSVGVEMTMADRGTYSIPVPSLITDFSPSAKGLAAIKALRSSLGDQVIDPGSYMIDREAEASGSKGAVAKGSGKRKHS